MSSFPAARCDIGAFFELFGWWCLLFQVVWPVFLLVDSQGTSPKVPITSGIIKSSCTSIVEGSSSFWAIVINSNQASQRVLTNSTTLSKQNVAGILDPTPGSMRGFSIPNFPVASGWLNQPHLKHMRSRQIGFIFPTEGVRILKKMKPPPSKNSHGLFRSAKSRGNAKHWRRSSYALSWKIPCSKSTPASLTGGEPQKILETKLGGVWDVQHHWNPSKNWEFASSDPTEKQTSWISSSPVILGGIISSISQTFFFRWRLAIRSSICRS